MIEIEPHTTITTILTGSGKIVTKSSDRLDRIWSKMNPKDRPFPQFQSAAEAFAAKYRLQIFACGNILCGYIWLCNYLPEPEVPHFYEVGEE